MGRTVGQWMFKFSRQHVVLDDVSLSLGEMQQRPRDFCSRSRAKSRRCIGDEEHLVKESLSASQAELGKRGTLPS